MFRAAIRGITDFLSCVLLRPNNVVFLTGRSSSLASYGLDENKKRTDQQVLFAAIAVKWLFTPDCLPQKTSPKNGFLHFSMPLVPRQE